MARSNGASRQPTQDAQTLELDLAETMRIMDVATTLRREQERVQHEFNLEQTKQLLRDKLIRTAELTGESLTLEQVDAAVNWYYDNLHEYREPGKSVSWYLAHAYVRRRQIMQWTIPLLLGLVTIWTLWLAPFAPFSRRNREQRRFNMAHEQVEKKIKSIRSAIPSRSVIGTLDQLESEALTHFANHDAEKLTSVNTRLTEIDTRINEEFTITVVGGEHQRSGFERFFEDENGKRISGYYIVVQARTANENILSRRIHNVETDKTERVRQWAERIPKSIYDRLVQDKTEDGVLDETIFATKKRGNLDVDMVMPGENDVPIQRRAQITDW